MKVVKVKVYLAKSAKLHPVIVQLMTDEGISGAGEAAIAYGVGGSAAAGMLKDLGERLVLGRDPFRIEELWSDMYDHTFWGKGGGPIVFAAISAIEQAMWDIKGKALGIPVYEFLGGKCRDDVRVYANGWYSGCQTVDDFARAGEKTVKEGYDALKCYPLAVAEPDPRGTIRHPTHRSLDRDTARLAVRKIKALRRAVGPDIDIMLDLSGGLTTDETLRLCRQWEELDIFFIEEPADPFNVEALKRISEQTSIPIAVGERLYTRYGFRKIFECGAADIIQPDIGNTGGILETKKIAAMAEVYNMRVQPHVCASPLSTAVALQLDACIPNFVIQEIYPYWSRHPDYIELIDCPPERQVMNGRLAVPNLPGLGVSLLEKQMEPFLWAECSR
jgi:galactonate dehydratase